MTDPPEQVDVAIVGGGIAGLSLAHRLRADAPLLRVALLEAGDRLGGKVATERVETRDGRFIVEQGPDAFLTQKPWAMDLARELGLDDRIVPIATVPHPASVLKRGAPHRLPQGVSLLAPTRFGPFLRSSLLSPLGRARALADLAVPRPDDEEDESLADFVRRRLGREALDWIAEPLMAGIYNADSERMGMAATFPAMQRLEHVHGSLIRGLRAARRRTVGTTPSPVFVSFQMGMQELTDALSRRVADVSRLDTPVGTIAGPTDGEFRIDMWNAPPLTARAVVLAIPAERAARLADSICAAAAATLRELRAVSAGAISLAVRSDRVGRPLPGYGLIVPRVERRPFNALTVASRKFPGRAPAGWTLLRLFFGGARSPETADLDDADLTESMRRQLHDLLGIAADPEFVRIARWPGGSPQYDVGHLERLRRIRTALPPGLFVAGGSFGGVGIPDIVHETQMLAARLISESTRTASDIGVRDAHPALAAH